MYCAPINKCLPIYVTHWFYAVQYNNCVIISQAGTAYITADQRVNRAPQNSSRVVAETQLAIFLKGGIVSYAGSSYIWINTVYNTFLNCRGTYTP
jgi:hypothetical protein